MIVIFDLFETLLEDLTLDFNLGLKPFWEEHYKDKCSFDEIKALKLEYTGVLPFYVYEGE